MINHCLCCNCVRLTQLHSLKSQKEQIDFLLNLNTLDRLRLIVNDSTYIFVDELLITPMVIDMKKLLFHIKSRFAHEDCVELHFFTDIDDKHITEICGLLAQYIIFQIDDIDDYFDIQETDQNKMIFETLKYMVSDECEFILNFILTTEEQKENYVNTLMRRYFVYYDFFRPYVTRETIKHFVEFHH